MSYVSTFLSSLYATGPKQTPFTSVHLEHINTPQLGSLMHDKDRKWQKAKRKASAKVQAKQNGVQCSCSPEIAYEYWSPPICSVVSTDQKGTNLEVI